MTQENTEPITQENVEPQDLSEIQGIVASLSQGEDNAEDSFYVEILQENPQMIEETEQVFDDTKANSYLFVIGRIQAEIQDCQDVADKQIQRAQDWLEREQIKREKVIQFLENKLFAFTLGTGKKTVSLPNGKLQVRSSQDKLEILEFEDLKKFCANNATPQLIRVKEEPDKMAIKKHIKTTGEVPDGCDLVPTPDKFSTKVEK